MDAEVWRALDALATWKMVFSRFGSARNDLLVAMGFATSEALKDGSYFYRITKDGAEAARLYRERMKETGSDGAPDSTRAV